jgi:hypothetical protein
MTDPGHNEVSSPGGGVAGRVAKVVADATVYTKQKLSDHQTKLGVQVFTDATNHVSDEIRSVMGPIFKKVAEHPDTPDEIRPLMQQLAAGRGQAWAWIAGTATGAAMGGGLMNLLTNELNPAILPLIASNPHGILSPADAVQAYVRGFISHTFAYDDARKGGLNADRFNALIDLATSRPAIGDILELMRRGHATHDWAEDQLKHMGFTVVDAAALLTLKEVPLSPQDLAAMWNRSIVDLATGQKEAAKSGVSAVDFKRMVELGGEPPGPQALGEALRRGFIDRKRYERGIVQGPVRNEWFDVLEQLNTSRMSTPDAADAVNQGHLTLSQGKEIATANGLDARDFATLIETAGAPPGIALAQEAFNRGLIDEHTFDTMFLESRIKNRYLPVIKATRFNLIPVETVRLMYRHGVYTKEDTLRTIQQHGYTEKDAAAMVALEEVRQTDTTRELTVTQIRQLYTDRVIALEDATAMLLSLGYSEPNARFVLELGDLARVQRYITTATNRVHASYLAGRIDDVTAGTALDRLGVTADQRDDLMILWDLERSTVSKGLTVAQITSAVKKGLMDAGAAMSRLVGQGYGEEDALVLLQLAGAVPVEQT